MARSAEKPALTRCPKCGWSYLYIRKDFNKPLGCAILLAGAVLSPFTWGVSLGVCALIDFILYRSLRNITVCYICETEFRNVAQNPEHKEFDLALDEGYERIREERRKKA